MSSMAALPKVLIDGWLWWDQMVPVKVYHHLATMLVAVTAVVLQPSLGDTLLTVLIGVVGTLLLYVVTMLRDTAAPFYATTLKIQRVFPGAKTNDELCRYIEESLTKFGYQTDKCLVATALCCDEINRPLEQALRTMYGGDYFAMGGLTGFSFGGVTAFNAMSSHIPDQGHCLIVYGPHVGVDLDGNVGMIHRRGRSKSGICCGSAITAYQQLKSKLTTIQPPVSMSVAAAARATAATTTTTATTSASSAPLTPIKASDPSTPTRESLLKSSSIASSSSSSSLSSIADAFLDSQQNMVINLLSPYARRLAAAPDPMLELPLAAFDAQNALMQRIVDKAVINSSSSTAAASPADDSSELPPSYIAVLGGIQINTPAGLPDYFLPLRFDLLNRRDGNLSESILDVPSRIPIVSIMSSFPQAIPNAYLVHKVSTVLSEYGFGKTTLLATSLCCDEVNRALEEDFQAVFGDHVNLGGLAGFPFGGVSGFGAMAHHIPDGGSCVVVYGPHIGVDQNGMIGTVDRRGRVNGGSCCGSAMAALSYVESVSKKGSLTIRRNPPVDPMDAQQSYVGDLLLSYAGRLQMAKNSIVELPYALFDAQDGMMQRIVAAGCGEIGAEGKICLLGGIQINTPEGIPDYFLPLRFDLMDNQGKLIKALSLN